MNDRVDPILERFPIWLALFKRECQSTSSSPIEPIRRPVPVVPCHTHHRPLPGPVACVARDQVTTLFEPPQHTAKPSSQVLLIQHFCFTPLVG